MNCCEGKIEALSALRGRQGRVLKIVLGLNAAMFVVEVASGVLGRSTALLGDSLDMLGDAFVYGVTLFALHGSAAWRARVGITKGAVMAIFAAGVLVEVVGKIVTGVVPAAETMASVGMLALAVNSMCLILLRHHRQDDINMRSAWVCSRNDILANLAVIVAAAGVRASSSWWPDALVGAGITVLFMHSAVAVLRDSFKAMRDADGNNPLEKPKPKEVS